jgi:VanZ family protein
MRKQFNFTKLPTLLFEQKCYVLIFNVRAHNDCIRYMKERSSQGRKRIKSKAHFKAYFVLGFSHARKKI